jgi:hypothetical protein
VYHRYRDSITPGQPLPKKVDQALGALELVLVNAVHERSQQLQAIVSQRPGFRENYVYGDTTLNKKGLYSVTYKFKCFGANEDEGNANIYREQRLWWILMQLQGEPDSHTRFRYAMLLDMLDDHLAKSSTEERARLDEILYEKLSDYATLLELFWSIRMHCPRNSIGNIKDCEQTEDRLVWRASKTAISTQIPEIAATVKALDEFRSTNAPAGPRDHAWLQQFDNMHKTLQDFWREMAFSYRKVYEENGFSEADVEYSMEPLRAWNDPAYIARLTKKRSRVEADLQKIQIVEYGDVFLPLPNPSDAPTKPDISQHVKVKPKTRGCPQAEDPKQAEEVPEVYSTPVKTIHLSKSPYTTLRCMFPITNEERQQSIGWVAFVNSMNETGFVARNGGGSIVRFESRNGEGSINFHRPHPDPTIDPVMLRAMGWRMNKWFGWVRETFVLVKK